MEDVEAFGEGGQTRTGEWAGTLGRGGTRNLGRWPVEETQERVGNLGKSMRQRETKGKNDEKVEREE